MRIFKLPRKIIEYITNFVTTAADPRGSDVYIVEFPKSGVTWLSTILANAALIQSGRPERATFYNVNQFIPDVHFYRHVGSPVYQYPPCRFIKSHATWNSNYKYIIYLVRHPVPVMKSYYRMLHELNSNPYDNFHDFCCSKSHGAPAWRSHIRSWLTGSTVSNRLHLLRYENLQASPESEINAINSNLGWHLSGESIRQAVTDSEMEKMKHSEILYKQRNPRHAINFVGGVSDFEVESRTVEYIVSYCVEELKLLNY